MPQEHHPVSLIRLTLKNFRRYTNTELDLNYPVVVFTGKNGSGKTTILEAIAMLSSLRSFRKSDDKDVIQWDADHYSLDLEYRGNKGQENLKLGFGKAASNESKNVRRLLINGKKANRINDFIGRFQTVVFSPEDIKIIESGPGERRKYVDMVLSLLSTGYLSALQKYRKTLEMRSRCLRNKTIDESYMNSIDRELSKYGVIIQLQRISFIREFQIPFNEYIQHISNNEDSWRIAYTPSIENITNENSYYEALLKNRRKDFALKQTTSGVHRDKINIHIAGNPKLDMKIVASQGQKRTGVLALKMAQYRYTQNKTHETPVILIDDVLTELDVERRTGFIKFMNDVGQALITVTDENSIKDFLKEKSSQKEMVRIFHVEKTDKGNVEVKLKS